MRKTEWLKQEHGATAVFVALALMLIFGSAVIAIDAGSLWSARRNLVTATDSAALGAAQYLAMNPDQVCTGNGYNTARAEAQKLLTNNFSEATLVSFDIIINDCAAGSARVKVSGKVDGTLFFAPVIGVDQSDVASTSTAQVGPVVSLSGLLPMAFCSQNRHVAEYLAGDIEAVGYLGGTEHPIYAAAGTVHRFYFTKLDSSECGDAPGSWGWVDFNSHQTPNGFAALREWIEAGGYDGTVKLTPRDCNPDEDGNQNCQPKTGGSGESLQDSLDKLTCPAGTSTDSCPQFWVIAYDNAICQGGGTTCEFEHMAFLGVVIRGHNKITGKEGGPEPCDPLAGNCPLTCDPLVPSTCLVPSKKSCGVEGDCPFFDLEFVKRAATSGEIGPLEPVNGPNSTPHLAQLCGVDHDVDRCDV